jgi:alpha-ribazole phosphatase
MLLLTLIRHATTAVNEERRYQGTTDPPLSERGRRESARLHARLQGECFDRVLASDRLRCTETAALAFPGTRAAPEPCLRELNFGAWDGRTYEECLAHDGQRFARWIAAPEREIPPGGEAFDDFACRVDGWIATLPNEGSILAFSHAGPIRRIIARALGLTWPQVVLMEISACGITRLVLHPDGGHLLCLNDTAHIDEGTA